MHLGVCPVREIYSSQMDETDGRGSQKNGLPYGPKRALNRKCCCPAWELSLQSTILLHILGESKINHRGIVSICRDTFIWPGVFEMCTTKKALMFFWSSDNTHHPSFSSYTTLTLLIAVINVSLPWDDHKWSGETGALFEWTTIHHVCCACFCTSL